MSLGKLPHNAKQRGLPNASTHIRFHGLPPCGQLAGRSAGQLDKVWSRQIGNAVFSVSSDEGEPACRQFRFVVVYAGLRVLPFGGSNKGIHGLQDART